VVNNNIKAKIADTMYQLLHKKSIDKITVKEVAEMSGISRPTFYYHFQDIYNVLEWMIKHKVDLLLQQSIATDDQEKAIRLFVKFCVEDRQIINRLLQSHQRELIEKTLEEGIEQYFIGMLMQKNIGNHLSIEEGKLAVEFCSFGITGICMKHCNDKDLDEEGLVRKLLVLTNGLEGKVRQIEECVKIK